MTKGTLQSGGQRYSFETNPNLELVFSRAENEENGLVFIDSIVNWSYGKRQVTVLVRYLIRFSDGQIW